MKKRFISLFLVLCFILFAFVGCTKGDESSETDMGSSPVVDDGFEKDDLPEKMDFGGKEITWAIVNTDTDTQFSGYFAEQSASMLDNSVYKASKAVEERLSVKLIFVEHVYPWDSRGEQLTMINNNIMLGVNDFDIITAPSYLPLYGSPELYLDLKKVENVSLDKPWWNQTMQEIFPNELRSIRCESSLRAIQRLSCVFFNQEALENYQINDDLYELVYSGNWTLEKMTQLITNTYVSADGTDSRTAKDSYGVTFGDGNTFSPFATAFGVTLYSKNGDGTYSYNAGSKRNVDIVDTTRKFITKNNDVLTSYNNESEDFKIDMTATGGSGVSRVFAEGRSLFMFGKFENGQVLFSQSSLDTEKLGVLPYPKYDSTQTNYTTASSADTFFIPVDASLPAACGAVIEAWASQYYRQVVPTYFETIVKTRYSSDSKMASMFDFIRSTSVVNFDLMFSDPDVLCMCPTVMKSALSGIFGLESWVVTAKKNESKASEQLKNILEIYNVK